jgi:hypothetical protein
MVRARSYQRSPLMFFNGSWDSEATGGLCSAIWCAEMKAKNMKVGTSCDAGTKHIQSNSRLLWGFGFTNKLYCF